MRHGWWSLVAVALTAACAGKGADQAGKDGPAKAPVDTLGSAEMKDGAGTSYGTLYLAQAVGGIAVFGELRHFPPGEFGLHVHTVGICDAPAFAGAGGHWNPGNRQHGINNPNGSHQGDLSNLLATKDSVAVVDQLTIGGTFTGDSTSLMDADGAAIVVHMQPDDYMTDPTGNAGGRAVCGVIVRK